ncbi:hypothetical protein BJ508DRAFT_328359 [Ascobolus immersus RN42]|uniref:Uncharacterized protein n=1 Tax=Ascobolus immersus RN42 TaxID=1160509 RepID=A0A3N4I5T2_ASCIM|nr:hypothetical protein BJ508DRAFT_328359 [Ascobolus immersus RN42]
MAASLLDLPAEILFDIFSYLITLTPNPNSKHNPKNWSGGFNREFRPHFILKPPSYYLRKLAPDADELTIVNRHYAHPLVTITCTSKHLSTLVSAFSQHIITTKAYGSPTPSSTEIKRGDHKRPTYMLIKTIWTQCTYCQKTGAAGARDPILPLYHRHFRICQKCDKERFPKITATECNKTYKVSREELDDRRNGIASGFMYVQGAPARLVLLEDVKRYVERRSRMREAIGWKPRMKITMKVWEWEREQRRLLDGTAEEEIEEEEEDDEEEDEEDEEVDEDEDDDVPDEDEEF